MPDTRFTEVLRDFTTQMKYVLVISAVSIVLLSVSLTAVEPGTSTHVITLIQLATFVVLFVGMVVLLWVTQRR